MHDTVRANGRLTDNTYVPAPATTGASGHRCCVTQLWFFRRAHVYAAATEVLLPRDSMPPHSHAAAN